MPAPFLALPIDAVVPQLLATLADRPSAVLVAPPGAGKTTRVPLALLDAPWRGDGRILVLEPRRLAARAAARRMAETLGEDVGATVGYRVRLDSRVSARTRVEVVTEGVFTRMILDDPSLDGVAAVLFDEFHERSLDGDLGLALTLETQGALRDDLRILVMSATIDGARVAALIGDAPVVESAGRAFPVDTRYLGRDAGRRIEDDVVRAIRRAFAEETGSALAFLPGQGEIRRVVDMLAASLGPDVDIAPLYGALEGRDQDRAIRPAPPGRRKLVVATSIAETSLTIEGVRIVIDSGYARVPRYEPATGLTRLETIRVSRASADQRRGRAGRTEPGICYRLWDEPQTAALLPFERPEILEADLAGLAMDLAAWGVAEPSSLTWLDPPPRGAWDEAVALLKDLDALDGAGRITAEGRALARLPLHPRLAHMIHRAAGDGAGRTAAEIAVLLQERGLGGTDPDLRDRLRRLGQDRTPRAEDARAMAARWDKAAGGRGGRVSPEDAGRILALAYPDRVAQARGAPGAFRLSNGRGAQLDPASSLSREPFLAIAEMQGAAANARVLLAVPLTQAEIEADFAAHIVTETEARFDDAANAVRVRRIRRYGRLVLSETPVARPDAGEIRAALIDAIRRKGLDCLPWTRATTQLRARLKFAALGAAADFPDLSDAALLAGLDDWLGPHIDGKRALADIGADTLANALDGLLPWDKRQALDRLAPTHFEAPTGSRVSLDYEAENGPVLAIRVQELFGLTAHPSIADGRVPLLLELLSPAHRPIQVTGDLIGFWKGSWRDVKVEMKGRYPRHVWPDDPMAALPTTRAKPRGT
ncbi:MAG: ATP-dependent helicase HrpB [Hyphomicrobiaceae bacterium]|nr:ATP-dependent helicase HrpB [Hyphomicrobiaceae bacterium]